MDERIRSKAARAALEISAVAYANALDDLHDAERLAALRKTTGAIRSVIDARARATVMFEQVSQHGRRVIVAERGCPIGNRLAPDRKLRPLPVPYVDVLGPDR